MQHVTNIPPCYLTPTGLATVKAEAALMGMRLRAMRAEREAAQLLARASLPALPRFVLGVA
jgi:hypothetical protein